IDQLEILRQQRASCLIPVDRPLVQRHNVLAPRLHGVAFQCGNVADVVLYWLLMDQLPAVLLADGADRPARDSGIKEERRIGITLVIEYGVQRSEAHLD